VKSKGIEKKMTANVDPAGIHAFTPGNPNTAVKLAITGE